MDRRVIITVATMAIYMATTINQSINAMAGFLAFSIVVEGFWDRKLYLWERILFATSSLLLLSQDSLLNLESYFDLVPNVHIIGLVIFCSIMAYHKLSRVKT